MVLRRPIALRYTEAETGVEEGKVMGIRARGDARMKGGGDAGCFIGVTLGVGFRM